MFCSPALQIGSSYDACLRCILLTSTLNEIIRAPQLIARQWKYIRVDGIVEAPAPGPGVQGSRGFEVSCVLHIAAMPVVARHIGVQRQSFRSVSTCTITKPHLLATEAAVALFSSSTQQQQHEVFQFLSHCQTFSRCSRLAVHPQRLPRGLPGCFDRAAEFSGILPGGQLATPRQYASVNHDKPRIES